MGMFDVSVQLKMDETVHMYEDAASERERNVQAQHEEYHTKMNSLGTRVEAMADKEIHLMHRVGEMAAQVTTEVLKMQGVEVRY